MNPPFSKDQDIDHVLHAYDLLKPGGRMTAVMSNMAGIRSNQKNRAFSEWLDTVGAVVEDIEPGAFKSSFNPTSVNTKIVVIDKPKAESRAKAQTKRQDSWTQMVKEFEQGQKKVAEAREKHKSSQYTARYQSYLDTLDNPADATNHGYMAWLSEPLSQYKALHGDTPGIPGKELDNWQAGLDRYVRDICRPADSG